MKLAKIRIKNWQTFSEMTLHCKDFLIFTGASDTGKSSLMKAILSFFQVRNLRESDIRNRELPLEIIGDFCDKRGNFQVKFLKKKEREIQYFIRYSAEWRKLEEKEFQELLSSISVFYIPSIAEDGQMDYLLERVFQNPKLKEYKHYWNEYQEARKSRKSHGFYRHLFLRFLFEVAGREEKNNFWENSILLWEEPEFYLNPQEERACYEKLLEHSKLGLNIIVSTNSSRFIDLEQYQSICVFRRLRNETRVYQYLGNLFSGDEVMEFNMNYWINPDRSELFFAKKVILVEGQTDKIILSYLSKKLGVYSYDDSIIECGSKSTIPQFIRLLNAFKIPYVTVYDKDNHAWRNSTEIFNSNQKNRSIQKMVHKKFGSYVELENDIEEEIYNENRERKNYKNKPFYALEKVMQEGYRLPKRLREKIYKIFE
ncbi:ATP-dependent nuclease [Fusobacterium necrophorum]|uniref:ATP-dependent nuclease n=1 Tax=Fusobacterium necrophorum TaxID=859 RepID=UPI00254FB34F|nr:TOPRIM nucleotidyl transferase/hydrolase domain-containing protein [Fusobacterium necrophorum]MDK4476074.1 AAA family ATPase [Fusobacterium necrophorum]MDK4492599.1 AAA family ATPase [Fusobacterium necrophorum]